MQPVSLALYWHQHQPYYPDDLSGETLLPWVRLHGTKDYYGMALHVAEVPEFRCTINLVPSLLVQIQRYAEQGGSDRHLDVSRAPADGLRRADACYLLDHFFMATVENMIRPYPRYYELYLKRGFGIDPVEKAVPRFTVRELRDLQVWHNLTWFHPLLFEQDPDLEAFRQKGQNWTEADKSWLLDRQRQVLAQIIPLHKRLAESGQIELTTTPFYHPILPLLWDKRSAREAMAGCKLPKHVDPYPEDARWHVDRAIEFHRKLFGESPRGMWPAEGSVSQDILAAVAQAGIQWIASDEEVLAASTDGLVSRDHHGHLRRPEMLFRPWRVGDGDRAMQMVFRDHALSDLIGFHYQRSEPLHAANDLLSRCEAIGRAVAGSNAGRPALVPIILDGENCWEYYPDGGVKFLRTLYRTAATHRWTRPVRMWDHLEKYPATDRINRLFAGSWISHNFAIWIGHEEDRTAWDLLHETREYVRGIEKEGTASAESLRKAWDEIYIAEGSDWYWWFGEDHSSAQDALFDQLFRKHLENAYTILGSEPPAVLQRPVARARGRAIHTRPTGFLPVKVDGRRTYFEWISAAHYVAGSERGTMTLTTEGTIRDIYFGFDKERLLVRIDTKRQARDDLYAVDELRLAFLEPPGLAVRVTRLNQSLPLAILTRHAKPVPAATVEAAVDHILEIAVPFSQLGVKVDDPIHMYVELFAGKQSIDRAPREGTLELTVPSADFELVMWQA